VLEVTTCVPPTPPNYPPFLKKGQITWLVGQACANFLEAQPQANATTHRLHVQSSMQGIGVGRNVLACCVASFHEVSMHVLCMLIECGRSCSWRGTDVLLFRALTVLRRGIERPDLLSGFRGGSRVLRVSVFGFCPVPLSLEVEIRPHSCLERFYISSIIVS
jgi:hypothetical protein